MVVHDTSLLIINKKIHFKSAKSGAVLHFMNTLFMHNLQYINVSVYLYMVKYAYTSYQTTSNARNLPFSRLFTLRLVNVMRIR